MPYVEDFEVEYVLSTAFFAQLLYWGSLTRLSPVKLKRMRACLDVYYRYRDDIMSGLIIPVIALPKVDNFTGFYSYLPNRNADYLIIYRNKTKKKTITFTLPVVNVHKEITDIYSGESWPLKKRLTISLEKQFSFRLLRIHQ